MKKVETMTDIETKKLLLSINEKLDDLSLLIPEWFPISQIASMLQKDPSTIRKYIKNHFEPNVQYLQEKENGTIYLRKDAVIALRRRYV